MSTEKWTKDTKRRWTRETHVEARETLSGGLSLSVVGQRMMLDEIERGWAEIERLTKERAELLDEARECTNTIADLRAARHHVNISCQCGREIRVTSSVDGCQSVKLTSEGSAPAPDRVQAVTEAMGGGEERSPSEPATPGMVDLDGALSLHAQARAGSETAAKSLVALVPMLVRDVRDIGAAARRIRRQRDEARAEVERLTAEQTSRPAPLTEAEALESGRWMVTHDDGTEAPYDADELAPAPEAAT